MHYFESASHATAMLDSLGRRSVPLKFAYAGSAKTTHAKLASSHGYIASNWMVESELDLLGKLSRTDKWAIFEFGPGDGIHTAAVLHSLRRTHQIAAYTGIDFSRSLFTVARPILQRALDSDLLDFQCADVEAPFALVATVSPEAKILFLMIGSLLGNVEDPMQTSRNICSSLPIDAIGLVSVSAYVESKDPQDYILPYETDVFRAAALEPLLAAGFPEGSTTLEMCWNEELRAIVGTAVVAYPVSIQLAGMRLSFLSEERIGVFISRRFTEQDVIRLLTGAGFKMMEIRHSSDASRLDALVSKPS